MHHITQLTELPPVAERVVIINCGTRWVTTLALMSAMKVARSPVLLIDCESRDGSQVHFSRLAKKYQLDFYWLEWPLRPHAAALDCLFKDIAAETVLLVDSDLEITDPNVIVTMREALRTQNDCYGAGFLHGPSWMGEDHGLYSRAAWYSERMWIPCVLLRTREIKAALAQGQSFAARRTYHDFPKHPTLSRIAGVRFELPFIRRWPLYRPRSNGTVQTLPIEPSEHMPSFVEYDTGADLHVWLQSEGKNFAKLPLHLWGRLNHLHGITRAALANPLFKPVLIIRGDWKNAFTQQKDVEKVIKERLRTEHDVSLE